jgi:hypothetical protein
MGNKPIHWIYFLLKAILGAVPIGPWSFLFVNFLISGVMAICSLPFHIFWVFNFLIVFAALFIFYLIFIVITVCFCLIFGAQIRMNQRSS